MTISFCNIHVIDHNFRIMLGTQIFYNFIISDKVNYNGTILVLHKFTTNITCFCSNYIVPPQKLCKKLVCIKLM